MTYLIKDLFDDERPREKLLNMGAKSLSDVELLSLILKTGGKGLSAIELSRELLRSSNGLSNLVQMNIEKLKATKNVGIAKAACIRAVGELSLRITTNQEKRREIKTPKDVFEVTRRDFHSKKREHLYIICLDSRNFFISKALVSIGTVVETLAHPREVYRIALSLNAVSVIIVHNHPSGDPTPSSDDLKLTDRLTKAGSIIGIHLLDHVIVTNTAFISIKALDMFKKSESFKERR